MPATNVRKKEQLLGTIQTKAVGLQYYDTDMVSGMPVNLERERDNVHNKNAIRVENAAFEPVGHLPRKVVACLAPLIDEGKIRIDGRVLGREGSNHSAPLNLSIYLAPKGSPILKKCRKPASGQAALHQLVLSATFKAKRGTVLRRFSIFQPFWSRCAEPRTYLRQGSYCRSWPKRSSASKLAVRVLT